MRVTVDREVCMSAGICVITADAVFSQDADGIVVLVSAEVPPALERSARNAVTLCPSGALRLAPGPA